MNNIYEKKRGAADEPDHTIYAQAQLPQWTNVRWQTGKCPDRNPQTIIERGILP